MSATASAADIEGSCMVSFNVKDESFMSGGVNQMSCTELESRRLDLFNQVNALPDNGQLDLTSVNDQLASVESSLSKLQENYDWIAFTTNVTGNFLATLSLGSCLETLGAGCAIAAVGKVISAVSIVNGGASDAEKATKVASIHHQISAIRQNLQGKSPQSAVLRNRLIQDFNGLCADVKKYCLQ
jgi:hypothetical protein